MKYSGAMRICVGTDVAIVTALICIEAFNIGGKTRAALCIGAIVSYILSQRMVSRRYERCGVQSENVSGFFWKFMVAFLTMLIVLGRDITVIILSILMSAFDVYEYIKARRIDKGL